MVNSISFERLLSAVKGLGHKHISIHRADGGTMRVRMRRIEDPLVCKDFYEGVRLWREDQKRHLSSRECAAPSK